MTVTQATSDKTLDPVQLVKSLGRFRRWVLPAGVMRKLMRQEPDVVMPIVRQRLEATIQVQEKGLGTGIPDSFLCYHLLGIAPAPSLKDLFDRLFRCDAKTVDACCGEITQPFTRGVLTAIADRDDVQSFCQWIDSLVQDDSIDPFVKHVPIQAMFNLVGKDLLEDSLAIEWVRKWLNQRKGTKYDELSSLVVTDFIDIGGSDLKELAIECLQTNQINSEYVDIDCFAEMPDQRQVEYLRKQAEADLEILADPIAYLSSWHAFAWTTDDLDPQTATCDRLPDHHPWPRDEPKANQIDKWLTAIDESNFECYPTDAVNNLDRNVAQVIEPLTERVRRGIKAAKLGEPISCNAPYLSALILARNADNREVMLQDADVFLDILDLTSEQQHEWFGDSIDGHLVLALSKMLAGKTEPMVQRCLETARKDIDRAALIPFLTFSAYCGYLERDACIQILRELWENLSRMEADGDDTTQLPKMAILDAGYLLSLPDSDLLMQQAADEEIENFLLSPQSAKTYQEQPEEARLAVHRDVVETRNLTEAIEQGGQFSDAAINPPKPHFGRKRLEPIHAIDTLQVPSETNDKAKTHVGRNDPCPCGSTKKYKKCCLRRSD